MNETKVWTKEEIKGKIEAGHRGWMEHSLLALYDRQTSEERSIEATVDHNGQGFNGLDAEILSSFAKQLKQRGSLSKKQYALLQRKLVKYCGQLTRIANREL